MQLRVRVWAGRVAMYAFDDARGPDPTLLAERFRVRAVATRDEDDGDDAVRDVLLARRRRRASAAKRERTPRRSRSAANARARCTSRTAPSPRARRPCATRQAPRSRARRCSNSRSRRREARRAHATLEVRVLEVLEEDDAGRPTPTTVGDRRRPTTAWIAPSSPRYLSLAFGAYVARDMARAGARRHRR